MRVVKCSDESYNRIKLVATRDGIPLSTALENLLRNADGEQGSSDAGRAATSNAADSVLSRESPVALQARDDPSHGFDPAMMGQTHEELLADLRVQLAAERERREAVETRLRAEAGDPISELGPDDAPIEAASDQPMNDTSDGGQGESEPAREKRKREPIFRFTFLDGLFGPDPD